MPSTLAGRGRGEQLCFLLARLVTGLVAADSVVVPDDRFDLVWTFTRTADGWRFAQVPELALPGDQGTVIKNSSSARTLPVPARRGARGAR
jgi:hypothetical protein